MLVGILVTVIPAIATFGYQAITKFNEVRSMYEGYSNTSSSASKALSKVETLEEKVNELRETNIKLQERLAEAVMAAREAKIVSESNQKELRAGLAAQKVELQVTSESLKMEMATVRKATTNRLGN
jgi:ABC-type phosphate transport system auxiliary subunit